MMIKVFARLCGCNPQTLRYYDHVNLLKPVKVDDRSGYRHYDEEQALDFVKIRDLQAAGFTIEEIRQLLGKDGAAVCAAFDAKIAEQEKRLEETKRIRDAYQADITMIRQRINRVKELIIRIMEQYDAEKEFGIDGEQYGEIMDMVTGSIDQVLPEAGMEFDPECLAEAEAQPEEDGCPDDPEYGTVYGKHGWKYAKEFLGEISIPEEGGDYRLEFSLEESKSALSIPFMNTIMSFLLLKNPGRRITLSCNVKKSRDGKNHFRLLKRR